MKKIHHYSIHKSPCPQEIQALQGASPWVIYGSLVVLSFWGNVLLHLHLDTSSGLVEFSHASPLTW